MLQNSRVTAFTVSKLLRENQQGEGGEVKLPPTHTLRLELIRFYYISLLQGYGKTSKVFTESKKHLESPTSRCN